MIIVCFFCLCDFELDYFVVCGELVGEFNMGFLCYWLIVGVDFDEFDNMFVIDCFCLWFFVGGDFIDLILIVDNFILLIVNFVYGFNLNLVVGVNINCNEMLIGYGIYV